MQKKQIYSLIIASMVTCLFISTTYAENNMQNINQAFSQKKYLTYLPHTLQNYISHIAKTHHTMNFIKIQDDLAHESIIEAKKGWRPQISAQGYIGRSRTDVNTTDERIITTAKFHQLTMSQPIYSGDRIGSRIRLAKMQENEANAQTKNDIDQFLFQGTEAYISFFKNSSLVTLYNETVENAKNRLTSIKAERDAGERTSTDIALATSHLATAEADLAHAKANLEAAHVSFTYYTGSHTPFKIDKKIDYLALETNFVPPHITYLYQYNPRIQKANAEINSAKENIKRAKAEYSASVTIDATATFNDRVDEIGRRLDSEDFSLLARYNLPLYERGIEYSQEKTARLQEKRAKNRLIALSGDISSEYQSNVLAYNASKTIVKSYKTALETAEKAAFAASKEYEYGFRSITELYDAEQNVTEAKSKLIDAKANKLTNILRLLKDLGELNQGY